MKYPLKKIFVTQKWGVNPEGYSVFGYKGHNGVDFRLFDERGNRANTANLYAPHDGVVKERRFDADGYGNYLKIESDKEGSILAHLKDFAVNINKQVKQGDLIGTCNSTGWSTGPHLHWGYYLKPRDRANGYGGTINQIPLMTNTMTDPKIEELQKQLEESNMHKTNLQNQVDGLLKDISDLKIEIQEEKNARKDTLQQIAGKLASSDDLVEILKEIEKLVVAEEGLVACLDDKRACEANYDSKAVELKQTYENIKLLSGYSIRSPEGVKRSLEAYSKLQGTMPTPDFSDYLFILKIKELLWLRK